MLQSSAKSGARLTEHRLTSRPLEGNPLGDPHERPILVCTPPGNEEDPGRRYPSVYVLQGWGGGLCAWSNRTPFGRPFTETVDAVFAVRGVPPALVVFVGRSWASRAEATGR